MTTPQPTTETTLYMKRIFSSSQILVEFLTRNGTLDYAHIITK